MATTSSRVDLATTTFRGAPATMSSKEMVAMTLSTETSNRATAQPTATIRCAEAMAMTLSMGTTPTFPGTDHSARGVICSMGATAMTACMAVAV